MEHGIETRPSVNALAMPLVDRLISDAGLLHTAVDSRPNGSTVVDAGIQCTGSFEAGRRIAEICMADLGTVKFRQRSESSVPQEEVRVKTLQPVLSCLASQYAGWSLEYKNDKTFRALGSGPARAMGSREPLFKELNYKDKFDRTCMIIETGEFPPDELIELIARDCGVNPQDLTLILTPTGSPAGVTQIAARVVEVALHKAHELQFNLDAILEGEGWAPIPPPSPDFMTAMGRTNDAIIFAGAVQLLVDCSDEDARSLAQNLPSSNSPDYGTPFAQKFAEYNYDFFQIDPMLFSPANVMVTAKQSGKKFSAGGINEELLERSFYGQR